MGDVYVDDELIFKAGASTRRNVVGDMLSKRMASIDWFDQTAIDLTNDYTSTLGGNLDAVALTAAGTNGVTMTTGTGDNEISFLATGLVFGITQKPVIEAKVEITDVSGTTAFFGYSDVTNDATPEAIIDADGGTLANGSGVADAVGFVIDADLDTSSIYCASVNTSGAVQSVDSGLAYTNGQTKRLRVELDASGNANFYVDGVQVGRILLAVADVPLCAVFDYGTRDNDNSNTVIARYLAKYQDLA